MPTEPIVKIAVPENEVEAQLLDAILDERGIVHDILPNFDLTFMDALKVQWGWGVVKAPESAGKEISTILSDIRADRR